MFRNKGEIDEHNTARLRFKYDALSEKDKISVASLVNLALECEQLLQDVNNCAPEWTIKEIDERIKLEEELVQLELVTIKVVRDILNEHVTYFDEIEGVKIDYWMHTEPEVIKSDNENASISQIEIFGKNATVLTWTDGTTEIQGIYNDGIDDIGAFRLRGVVAVDTMIELAASIHLEKGRT